jgi:hypothetical protein
MDLEEYTRKITAINDQLQAIADMTAKQALAGCANPNNPLFVAVMQQQERLTTLSEKLTNEAMRALGLSTK